MPESLVLIGQMSFAGCGFESIYIPESVAEIWAGAFTGCENLKVITILNTVKIIGESAFEGCPEDLVIRTPKGSAADKYAKNNNIAVEYIDAVREMGDVNNDLNINVSDATLVLQAYSGVIADASDGFDIEYADVNSDSIVNATDATYILQMYAGIISYYPKDM